MSAPPEVPRPGRPAKRKGQPLSPQQLATALGHALAAGKAKLEAAIARGEHADLTISVSRYGVGVCCERTERECLSLVPGAAGVAPTLGWTRARTPR